MRTGPHIPLLGLLFSILIFAGLTGGAVLADSDSRHDEVLKHRQMRNILPFEKILKAVRPHIRGQIIEAEFEIEDGTPVYEFKFIDASGRVLEVYVDARTGKIIKKADD